MISVQRERNYSSKHHSRALIAILIAVFLTSAMTATMPITPVRAANIWYVDPLGTDDGSHGTGPGANAFKTIQYAINDARVLGGDTINVAAGTYNEALLIDKSLTLLGAKAGVDARTRDTSTGESILDGTGLIGAKGIIIKSVDVTVRGFEIRNFPCEGIYWEKSANRATVSENVIHDNGWLGVVVKRSNDNIISKNAIYKNSKYTDDSQIRIFGDSSGTSSGNIICENDIYGGNTRGVDLFSYTSGTTLLKNAIHDNGEFGILVEGSGGNTISGNIIYRNLGDSGVRLCASSSNTIEGNEIYENTWRGIDLVDGANMNTLKGNAIHDNGEWGVLIEGSNNNIMLENDIYKNAFGISNAGSGNMAHHNNIYNNGYGAESLDSFLDAENNWWGDSSGPGGVGPGTGDAVSDYVNFTPWLTAPIAAGGVKSETVSGSGMVDAMAEADTTVDIDALGGHTVTVAKYESNPGTGFVAGKNSIGKYVDVNLDSVAGVTQVEIHLYYTDAEVAGLDESSLKMYYWDGATWAVCSNTGVNTAANYIWAIISATTTPTLAFLLGGPLGGGGNPKPSPSIGGEVYPVDKLALLAPYITAILALATTAVVVKRRRH